MLTVWADLKEESGDADATKWVSGACGHLCAVDEVHNVHLERVICAKHHVLACCAKEAEQAVTISNSLLRNRRETMWIIAI